MSSEIETQPESPSVRAEEALLGQLRRTSELVAAQRLPEAELELLRAQSAAPHDLRVLKLLALVRFKLGRLAEARQIYRQAVEIAPEDAAIRQNLGLIALKLDWFEEAVSELETTVRLRPDDRRAWSYLGYACARTGARAQAAAAFRRAGQHELAAEMERGASNTPGVETTSPATVPAADDHVPIEIVPPADPTPRPELRAVTSDEQTPAPAPARNGEIASLTSFVTARLLPAASGSTPVGWLREDILRFAAAAETHVRESALLAALGAVGLCPALRRTRGQVTGEPLVARGDRFLRATGSGDLWLAPPRPFATLYALSLDRDVVYLRDERVVAWADEVVWEWGRVPGDGPAMLLFRGTGRVVLSANPDEVLALRLAEGEQLSVPSARLVGWVGHVVAQAAPCMAGGPGAPYVACEGEGVLLLSRHGEPAQSADQCPQFGDDGASPVRSRGPVLHR